METELKFAVSPQARGAVERHVVRSALESEPVVEIDHTIYFDTPDGALKRAGFSLRVRHRIDTDQYCQTVKSEGNGRFARAPGMGVAAVRPRSRLRPPRRREGAA
jgi:inorganic triphosphatase YgiF